MNDFGKMIHFQTMKDVTTITNTILWILEHELKLTPDEFKIKRKMFLDLLGKTNRNLYNNLQGLDIHFK